MPVFFPKDKDDETKKKIIEHVRKTLGFPWDGIKEESVREGMTKFLVMMATEFEDPLYIEILKITKDPISYENMLLALDADSEKVESYVKKLEEYKFVSQKDDVYQARESVQLVYDPDFLRILQQVTDIFITYGKDHDIVF